MLHHYPDPGVDCRATGGRRWWQAWSAPELRIVICSDEVEVFMFCRPWLPGNPRVLQGHTRHALPGDSQALSPPEAVWQVLHDILAPLAGQRWHVVVIISNQFARWLVLPWQADIRSLSDRYAYHHHGLQQAFGNDSQDWQIQAYTTAYGQTTLVNALPLSLIGQLHATLQAHRLPVGMIAPAWQLSANQVLHRLRREKKAENGWIVCRESGSLTLACLVNGEWQHIRYVPVDAQWRQTLHQVLLREQVLNPARVSLPVYLSQPSGIQRDELAPFTVVEVFPRQGLGEAFNQTLRRRLA